MTERLRIDEQSRPRLGPNVRLHFDAAREKWVILAPERVLMPDEIAVEILKRCDGAATVAMIADALAAQYGAPRQTVSQDICELLQDLADKRLVSA
jgi:pyrroloquinoline quinone biosynthesis protein D